MERSQSYSSFETSSNRNNSNGNNNNNINNNNMKSNISSASLQLLKAVELRETLLQQHHKLQQQLREQKQQQQLQQHLLHYEPLNQQHQQQLHQQQPYQQHQQQQLQQQQQQLPRFTSQEQRINESRLRLKMLQRQEATTAYLDEVDYAADLEEDEDDDELNRTLTPEDDGYELSGAVFATMAPPPPPTAIAPHTPTLALTSHQKQQQFQQRKPQSAAALIMRATSTTSTNSGSNCCCSSASSSSSASTTSGSASSNTTAASAERRRRLRHEESFDSAPADLSPSPLRRHTAAAQLQRDNSVQSDSSRYSSVDSLLESRKPDPEVILINLGFGNVGSDILSRIPKRFLGPSQVRGIDTDEFVRRVQLANTLADHSVLGYRGLTGNPDLPPSSIVAKIMKRFELYQRKKSMDSVDLKKR